MINVNELGPGIAIYFGKGLKFHLAETTIYGFILATVLAVLGIDRKSTRLNSSHLR